MADSQICSFDKYTQYLNLEFNDIIVQMKTEIHNSYILKQLEDQKEDDETADHN